ncbi:HepT-like ribonuclease domain-containing protein [uncultured Duncaniella sp.]|uniref:HepT-like ribonuclease domain-containing protein n=1 Tax=uncultured Duncaniella sp. TaxID=2768039 RepID=UPI0025E29B8E|nr:HepT-like ribonuclease domain-containing protein [uncultured Duncaniella sp.]
MSFDKTLVNQILTQIVDAIDNLEQWNTDITCGDDYLCSPEGMKTLAASSMLLAAIGEGLKKIDRRTSGSFLTLRDEIPWSDVMGMRDHIAHGYFDIDAEIVCDVIKNDLAELREAIVFLRNTLEN